MEVTYRSQEEVDFDTLPSRLSNELVKICLGLEAAAQGGPPARVDLYRILNQCLRLDALRVTLELKIGTANSPENGSLRSLTSLVADMI